MTKIILCGLKNHILEDTADILKEHFEVQVCTGDLAALNLAVNTLHPQMIIVNLIGSKQINLPLLQTLSEQNSTMKILVLAKPSHVPELNKTDSENRFYYLYSPIRLSNLYQKCNDLLGTSLQLPEKSFADSHSDSTQKTVMVIDDSPLFFRSVKRLLEEKYHVVYANSGDKAMVQLGSNHVDVIMLDYEMPGKNGAQTFEMIKKNPEYRHIPIIFLTAVSASEKVIELLSLCPFGYLLKPLNPEKLMFMIEEALQWIDEADRLIVG